jgi:hypothetical protein
MKTPAFLIGLALLFWGWRIDALWLAALMAALIEASRWIRARFEFSQSDLDRIWNLCVLLFVASAVIAFALSDGFDAIGSMVTDSSPARRLEVFNKSASTAIRFLQYTPATLFPILLAQAFAQRERFPWSTFSSLLRKRRRMTVGRSELRPGAPATAEPGMNVSYPFLGVVLFASALTSGQSPWFISG